MKLGMVGMGRMGGNMAERLRRAGHVVETRSGNEVAVRSGLVRAKASTT
jgi:3-hydroxyisobutyrate dehydrogenase-like beta-hydroxyacid dehydrogenase